jgi:hypothetical protein
VEKQTKERAFSLARMMRLREFLLSSNRTLEDRKKIFENNTRIQREGHKHHLPSFYLVYTETVKLFKIAFRVKFKFKNPIVNIHPA